MNGEQVKFHARIEGFIVVSFASEFFLTAIVVLTRASNFGSRSLVTLKIKERIDFQNTNLIEVK